MTDLASSLEQREGGREPALFSSLRQNVRSSRTGVPSRAAVGANEQGLHPAVGPLDNLPLEALVLHWRNHLGGSPPRHLPRWFMAKILAYRLQAGAHGDLSPATLRLIKGKGERRSEGATPFQTRSPVLREGGSLRPGSMLVREWQGRLERVMVLDDGFAWQGRSYSSLSAVAKAITGTSWNGHRFFALAQQARSLGKGKRRYSSGSHSEARP